MSETRTEPDTSLGMSNGVWQVKKFRIRTRPLAERRHRSVDSDIAPAQMMRVPCTKGFAKLKDTPQPLPPLAFQAEALDLSGLGFWQGGCEYDVTGVFVGGNRGFHMILQQFHQRL